MKALKHLFILAAAVGCLGLASAAHATIINISMDPSTGQPAGDTDKGYWGANDPTTNFSSLVTEVSLYETYFSTDLPDPVFAGYANYENFRSNPTVDLTGFDYAVLHYGTGNGGSGNGGGIVFYYLNGMTGNFVFPANGLGPNGFGGISSIRLFGGQPQQTPEGGTTVMLLGVALCGLALTRRLMLRHG